MCLVSLFLTYLQFQDKDLCLQVPVALRLLFQGYTVRILCAWYASCGLEKTKLLSSNHKACILLYIHEWVWFNWYLLKVTCIVLIFASYFNKTFVLLHYLIACRLSSKAAWHLKIFQIFWSLFNFTHTLPHLIILHSMLHYSFLEINAYFSLITSLKGKMAVPLLALSPKHFWLQNDLPFSTLPTRGAGLEKE